MVPDDDNIKSHPQYRHLLKIDGQYLTSESFGVENKRDLKDFYFNEMALFRIDLPCFPKLWDDVLYLKVELLLLVDVSSKATKRFEIVDDKYAIIDTSTIRIEEALGSRI